MGNMSNRETMSHAEETPQKPAVPVEREVVSVRRTPEELYDYPGMAASTTDLAD